MERVIARRVGGKSTDEEVEAALRLIAQRDRGSLLAYDELERVTGVRRHEPRFRAVIRRVKIQAAERFEKWLKAKPNEGYEIRGEENQFRDGLGFFAQAARRCHTGHRVVKFTRRAGLPEPYQQAQDFVLRTYSDLERTLRQKRLAFVKLVSTPALPFPRPEQTS